MTSVWARLEELAAIFLDDRSRHETETCRLCEEERQDWKRLESAIKAEAKKLKAKRKEAEKTVRLESKKSKAIPLQSAVGAKNMQRGDHAEIAQCLADYLAQKHLSPPAYDEGVVHVYMADCGRWLAIEDSELSAIIQGWAGVATIGEDYRPWFCNNVKTPIDMMKDLTARWGHGPGFFRGTEIGIAFSDEYVTVHSGVIVSKKHKPANRARFGFDFSIKNASLSGSSFEYYLSSLFDDESRTSLLGEFFGLTALGMAPKFNKALILYGPGGAGKGTFLRIMQAAFPSARVGSIQPQRWTHGPSLAALSSIRLNMVNEMSVDDLNDVGRFKAIVSGDLVEAEPKYRDVFSFCPSAGHVFTVNPGQLPTVPDADEPFWQRWMAIPFDRVFRGNIGEDRDIVSKIIKKELHIVVAWMLYHAQQAINRKNYTECKAGIQVIDEWRGSVNPVAHVLAERTKPLESSVAYKAPTLQEVFLEYQKWCNEAGHKASSRTVLTRRLRSLDLIKRSSGNRVMVALCKPHEQAMDDDLDWLGN